MKTLTCGWSQAAERPNPGGAGESQIFVQVKLSNSELMHSLGISSPAMNWPKPGGNVKEAIISVTAPG